MATKQPGAFVRVHPKDYKTIKRLAASKGLPVSNWMRMIILDAMRRQDQQAANEAEAARD